MIGWFLLGALAGAVAITVIDRFWEDIAHWLNNTAANAVERVLGYNAKKNMHRAVTTISKVRDYLHNTTVVYTKENPMDSFLQKVTYETDAPVYQIDTEVVEEIKKQGEIVKAFEYRH
ncbi:hypothetical protein C823_005681 [Eubacterium plexicaudatum ASF492]|uniref:Uncharacterized protein n=1 Tax=Eubacterium plexicaudatum ASF492 TaxID=1235802 RepID=N2B3V7_9FIRM|nr:hypothetical protein C823_005681 [Eubacterium plexicaudatum ASF492]